MVEGVLAVKGKKGKKGKSVRQSMKEPIPEPAAAAMKETSEPAQSSEETKVEDALDLGQAEPSLSPSPQGHSRGHSRT